MDVVHYLALLHHAEADLASAFRDVAAAHRDEPDVEENGERMARWSDHHVELLAPVIDRYGEADGDAPDRLHAECFGGTRTGGLGLLRDLQDLYVMVAGCDITWTVVAQAAAGARDRELSDICRRSQAETTRQQAWLRTRMKQAAPQALVVS
jgi:hypothetical protein